MRAHVSLEKQFEITELYTAFKTTHTRKYFFAGETHNFWEIVIVLDGQIGAVADNKVFILNKKQAIIHSPMEFHKLWVESHDTATILIFTFMAENMPNDVPKIFEIEDLMFAEEVLCEMKDAFDMKYINVVDIKKDCELRASVAVKKLEMLLLLAMSKKVHIETRRKTKNSKMFESIMSVLEVHDNENLSVDDIAKMANISKSYLQRIFTEHVGMGAKSYFNKMRMHRAVSMIQDGMSIAETSERLGFSDPNYFSTSFKRIMGQKPSYYKKNS